ncbi:MAG: segregation/condensation protein A [Actinobacteria bacterium]|nr:segregation/condensation protein A [Actinomycetota bacterium]
MSYAVSTPVYEGPFELLLHLILKEEVELWDVSIAQVIDAFLVEVEHLDRLDLETATEFLLIASTLVELKARRLLPGAEPAELDEELLRFEERDLLLARLLECKTFKDAATVIASGLRAGARTIARSAGPEEPFRSMAPDPLERVTPAALLAAAKRALAVKEPAVVDTYHVAPIRVSVRDAVEALLVALPADASTSFRALVRGIDDRLEVIVRFLAVLELYKQGLVDIDQAETFGDLVVRRLAHGARSLDATSLDDWEQSPVMVGD